jgi:hypothetical protein
MLINELLCKNLGVMGRNEAHSTDVCCQRVNLVHPSRRLKTIFPSSKIQELKLVRVCCVYIRDI